MHMTCISALVLNQFELHITCISFFTERFFITVIDIMEQDKFALVEKILKDVDNVMCKNGELFVFDIVPVENNWQNKSPVLHLDNCLALESWCVKHVYMYCYSELMDKYFTKPKRKALKVTSMNAERLTQLLNVTLLLNPELTLLWNKRRELYTKSLLEKMSELRFARLILSRKPKCNDAFSYRRWILSLMFQGDFLQGNHNIDDLVNEELNVCELSSDKSPNNYHSWSHRMWLMKKLKNFENVLDLDSLFTKEYNFSEQWTSKHISDFSSFHYRQFCIKNVYSLKSIEQWRYFEKNVNISLRKGFVRTLASNFPREVTIQASENDLCLYTEENLIEMLLSNSFKSCNCGINDYVICKKIELLFNELVLNDESLRFYKFHETLWYHRKFIMHEILSTMYDHYGLFRQNGALLKTTCRKCNVDECPEKQIKIVRYDNNKIYSSVLFRVLITHERKFCEERRADGDKYSDRHEKYLKFIEGIKI